MLNADAKQFPSNVRMSSPETNAFQVEYSTTGDEN